MIRLIVLAIVLTGSIWVQEPAGGENDNPCSRFKMKIVKPSESVDYKMIVVKPAEGIDYKGRVIDPCRPPLQQIISPPKKILPKDQKPAPAIAPWQRMSPGVEGGLKSPSEMLRQYQRFPNQKRAETK